MKHLVILFVLTMSFFFYACDGWADEDEIEKSGLDYIGIGYAKGSIGIRDMGVHNADDEDRLYKIFIGTGLNNDFGLEYGYGNLGKYSAHYQYSVGTFDFNESHRIHFDESYFISLIGRTSFDNPLNMYIKVGMTYWKAEIKMDGFMYDAGLPSGPYGTSGDGRGLSYFIGTGIDFTINENSLIRLELERYDNVGKGVKLKFTDGTRSDFDGKDVDLIGLALLFKY